MIDILLIGIGIFVGLGVWFAYQIHTAPHGEEIPGVGYVDTPDAEQPGYDWLDQIGDPNELILTDDMIERTK